MAPEGSAQGVNEHFTQGASHFRKPWGAPVLRMVHHLQLIRGLFQEYSCILGIVENNHLKEGTAISHTGFSTTDKSYFLYMSYLHPSQEERARGRSAILVQK